MKGLGMDRREGKRDEEDRISRIRMENGWIERRRRK